MGEGSHEVHIYKILFQENFISINKKQAEKLQIGNYVELKHHPGNYEIINKWHSPNSNRGKESYYFKVRDGNRERTVGIEDIRKNYH